MDAFFASIEEQNNSRLQGLPIVVGADPLGGRGRGVVSTANYAARAYGIRSALPISKAWEFSEAAKRCGLPPAVFMDVDMQKYADVSHRIMRILRECLGAGPVIEQASVDEAYFDLSFLDSYDAARDAAQNIKREIRTREKLTASIGIGPNKLVAKIASDAQKPDGLTVVHELDAEDFLAPMNIRKIPGVGPKSEEQCAKLGMKTVRDARRLTLAELKDMMGKWGGALYEKLRGRDDTELVEEYEAKSIGRHETFANDVPARRSSERSELPGGNACRACGRCFSAFSRGCCRRSFVQNVPQSDDHRPLRGFQNRYAHNDARCAGFSSR